MAQVEKAEAKAMSCPRPAESLTLRIKSAPKPKAGNETDVRVRLEEYQCIDCGRSMSKENYEHRYVCDSCDMSYDLMEGKDDFM